jgi:hypothetical protein
VPYSGEEHARAEERAAAEWLLQREHAKDLRRQLRAAVELLAERTGLSLKEVNAALAQRVAANRKGPSCEVD